MKPAGHWIRSQGRAWVINSNNWVYYVLDVHGPVEEAVCGRG